MFGEIGGLGYAIVFMIAAMLGWAVSRRQRGKRENERKDYIRSLNGRR